MRLIANKPCNFGGKKFLIGDEIPAELVGNPKSQEKMGVLSIASGEGVGESSPIPISDGAKFEIPIHTEDGDIPLRITNAELSVFTDILQIDVKKAEDKQKISEMIQNVESQDLLIMLDALDGRKFVSDEAKARADALSGNSDPEEELGGADEDSGNDVEPGGDE